MLSRGYNPGHIFQSRDFGISGFKIISIPRSRDFSALYLANQIFVNVNLGSSEKKDMYLI